MLQIQIPGRFSYVYTFQKTKPRDGKDGNYQVDILWNKSDQQTTQLVGNAIQQVYAQAQQDPKLNEAMVRGSFKADVIKDGARTKFGKADYDRYKDCYYVVAKSSQPIQVIDQQTGIQLLTEREFFSGCYGIAGVTIKTYQPTEKVPQSGYGINIGLLALMKTGGTEADRWSGAVTVNANDFFGVQAQPGFGAPTASPFGGPQQPASPYGAAGPVAAPFGNQAPFGAPQTGMAPGSAQPHFQQPAQQAPAAGAPFGNPAPQTQFGPPAQPVGQPAPAAQGFAGAPQGNPFPQTWLPQQPVAQPGFQTGQSAQFPPAQPQQPAGPHQPTPAFGAPQGFDPYAGQR